MRTRAAGALVITTLALATAAQAQTRFLIADRTNHAIWMVHDINNNGVIEEPGEVSLFFNAANAAGTPAPLAPSCLAVRRDGLVVFGDNDASRRAIYLLRDLDGDGNANGLGESRIAADGTNSASISFAAPAGAAFDSRGRLYISNSGNASGADAIYRLVDLNGDGDFQDQVGGVNEITPYVADPFFGPGNGPFVPSEIVFDAADVMYMHDSGASTHGVYRFEDLNHNGRADDPGEATTFFSSANASGVTIAAGFAIDVDPVHPRSVYMLQTGSGPTQQLYRLTDANSNGTANDAGEAVLVWSTAESGFTSVDVVALYDGRVLITDGSTASKRVIMLTDLDHDGLFNNTTERTTFYSGSTLLGVVRQMNILPCQADWDHNGLIQPADVAAFVNDWFSSLTQSTAAGDFDFSGTITPADVAGFVNTWFAAINGGC